MTTDSAIDKLRATFEHGSIDLPAIAYALQQQCGVKPKSLGDLFKTLPAMFKDDPRVATTLSNLCLMYVILNLALELRVAIGLLGVYTDCTQCTQTVHTVHCHPGQCMVRVEACAAHHP